MKNLLAGLSLLLPVLLAVFVWPTRYRYESLKLGERTITMRTDRFSDKTWMLLPGGWNQQSKPRSKPMPEVLFTKLNRSTCSMNYIDDLSCDVSNETDMAISSVMVEISWKDEKGKEPCLVEMKGSVSPHTMATLSVKPPCGKDMKQSTYTWRFVSVQADQPE